MKRVICATSLSALIVATVPVVADDAHHPPEEKADSVTQAVPPLPASDKRTVQMQERMQKLHEQMDRIHETTDPNERRILMRQHMETMQEQMRDMNAMSGGMPTEMGGSQTQDMNVDEGMGLMEKCSEMTQMMMEHMMQREQVEPLP